MKRVVAFVLAGGRTVNLSVLTRHRSVAAVPFAGKFRLIDFTLSNCVNSEIYRVGVLAQYAPLSLVEHIGRGRPWDLDRREGGVHILQPYARQEGARWYQGTADALRQNLEVLDDSEAEMVFVLSADIVYKMDYSWMLQHHKDRGAAVTLAVSPPPHGEPWHYSAVQVSDDGSVTGFQERGKGDPGLPIFMGVSLWSADALRRMLLEVPGEHLILDLLRPEMSRPGFVCAYPFDGYWDEIGSVPRYLRAHQRLLAPDPAPQLADADWRMYTRSEEMSPVLIRDTADVRDSLISNGAVIEGRIERSVISPGVHVAAGATVRDSVILGGAVICPGAVVERAVIDKNVLVRGGARVGSLDLPEGGDPDLEGIAVVGKWAEILEGESVGAGAIVPASDPLAPELYRLRLEEALG